MSRTLDPARLNDHVDKLYRAAWAMCGNQYDAEDLVQETYTRLLARPRRVREHGDLGYLLTALRNTYINHFRSKQRRPLQIGLPAEYEMPASDPGQQPDALAETRDVFAALSRLPDELGAAIMAVDIFGLSPPEAAKATGQDPKLLERHLARARIALGRQLAPERAVGRTSS